MDTTDRLVELLADAREEVAKLNHVIDTYAGREIGRAIEALSPASGKVCETCRFPIVPGEHAWTVRASADNVRIWHHRQCSEPPSPPSAATGTEPKYIMGVDWGSSPAGHTTNTEPFGSATGGPGRAKCETVPAGHTTTDKETPGQPAPEHADRSAAREEDRVGDSPPKGWNPSPTTVSRGQVGTSSSSGSTADRAWSEEQIEATRAINGASIAYRMATIDIREFCAEIAKHSALFSQRPSVTPTREEIEVALEDAFSDGTDVKLFASELGRMSRVVLSLLAPASAGTETMQACPNSVEAMLEAIRQQGVDAKALTAERDALRAERDALAKQLQNWQAGCVHCGWNGDGRGSLSEVEADQRRHDLTCPSHPMRTVERDLAAMKVRLYETESALSLWSGNANKNAEQNVAHLVRIGELERDLAAAREKIAIMEKALDGSRTLNANLQSQLAQRAGGVSEAMRIVCGIDVLGMERNSADGVLTIRGRSPRRVTEIQTAFSEAHCELAAITSGTSVLLPAQEVERLREQETQLRSVYKTLGLTLAAIDERVVHESRERKLTSDQLLDTLHRLIEAEEKLRASASGAQRITGEQLWEAFRSELVSGNACLAWGNADAYSRERYEAVAARLSAPQPASAVDVACEADGLSDEEIARRFASAYRAELGGIGASFNPGTLAEVRVARALFERKGAV